MSRITRITSTSHRITVLTILAALGTIAGTIAATGSPMFADARGFNGFDDNPAAGALYAENATTSTFDGFDGNPAGAATDAVPRQMREEPRLQQRTRVTANTTTTGNTSAQQRTSTGIDDRIDYTLDRDFDNVFITQDADSRIRQECRVTGSCAQDADSSINQDANVQITGRFSNVFVEQRAASDVVQDCAAGEECEQQEDQKINQDAEFDTTWSSNGFASHDRDIMRRQEARLFGQ